jgi:hypothetical protein
MATENTSTHSGEGQASNTQNPQTQVVNSDGQAPNETHNSNLSREEALIELAKARAQSADNRIKLKKFEDDAKKQEATAKAALEAQLKEQGEFKKLAEQHEARVKELEPIAQNYAQLSQLVSSQIDTRIKDWPAEVKALVPDASTPVEQRIEQVEKLQSLVEKLQTQARAQLPGNAPNPRPSQTSHDNTEQTYLNKLSGTGKYSRF